MLIKRKELLGIVMGLLLPLSMIAQTVSKVGTLSLIRAIGECSEGKVALGEFQKKVDAKRGELEKMNNEVQGLQKQLQEQARTLNDESRAALSKNIDVKNTELQRAQEDAQKEFGQLQQEIFNRIGSKLMPVLQQYAKENNFAVIVDSSSQTTQVVYADPSIDVTDDIIKRFDAQSGPSTPATSGAKPAPVQPKPAPAPVQPKPTPAPPKP
jgi:Skp family chaperone for outer membrane proteins